MLTKENNLFFFKFLRNSLNRKLFIYLIVLRSELNRIGKRITNKEYLPIINTLNIKMCYN